MHSTQSQDVTDPQPLEGQRRNRRDGRSPGRARWVIVGLLVALVVVAAFVGQLLNRGPGERTVALVRGVACSYLSAAFEARRSGDDQAFRDSVKAAARVAEESLDRSGQLFGTPEKLAIELGFALSRAQARGGRYIDGHLDRAAEACSQLGRWPRA